MEGTKNPTYHCLSYSTQKYLKVQKADFGHIICFDSLGRTKMHTKPPNLGLTAATLFLTQRGSI